MKAGVGADGVEDVFTPQLDPDEHEALARSIATLQQALARVSPPRTPK